MKIRLSGFFWFLVWFFGYIAMIVLVMTSVQRSGALVNDLVHGGLLVAGTGDDVLVIGRNITTKY